METILQTPSNPLINQIAPAAAFVSQKRPLVLVAEDDKDNRSELKVLLDLYGIDVLEAGDGEDAIDLIVRECPDLVLMNVELPVLDGYEAARLIRSIKSFDKMPIIFLSGQTERVFRKRAFAVGGDSYHFAPLDFERLDRILENFLFRK